MPIRNAFGTDSIDLYQPVALAVPATVQGWCGNGVLEGSEECDGAAGNCLDPCNASCKCVIQPAPPEWTCDPSYYDEVGDLCDCGCGAPDPDCADATAGSCDFCDDPGSCSPGACPSNIDPANNATCLP